MPIRSKRKSLSNTDLQVCIDSLQQFYLPLNLDPEHEYKKKLALNQLDFILKCASPQQLQSAKSDEMLMCALALVYYYGMRLKLKQLSKIRTLYFKRTFVKVENCFQLMLDNVMPGHSEGVIRIVLNFCTDLALWPYEEFVRQVLEVVMYYSGGATRLFNLILTDLHCVLNGDVRMARHRMRVLYELLNSEHWLINTLRLMPFVTRLLDFFALSLSKVDSNVASYSCLRKGFVLCLKRTFERVENQYRLTVIVTMLNWSAMIKMNDFEMLEFEELLVYAAELYQVGLYSDALSEEFLDHVLSHLVGSSNQLSSLLGCRLLQRLFDRQRNLPYILTPTIYYECSHATGVNIGEYDSSDKTFMSHYRERLHDTILKAVILHCTNITNLKAAVSIMSCLILEVPCGLTAAAAACLLMAIQDFALNGPGVPDTCRYWMHAIVVSTMSLICWVHKAPVLYGYVNQIVARRASGAAHMNPPLLLCYKIATAYATRSPHSLFFEDWELRYGLWKHFQGAVKKVKPEYKKSHKKAPRLCILTS